MSYATDHTAALAEITDAGAAVTFTRTTRTYTAATDTSTVATETVSGYAMRVKGDPVVYASLNLVESSAPTLLFVPTTFGETPEPGDAVTWADVAYTVRSVQPLAPDGTAILARVVVAR